MRNLTLGLEFVALLAALAAGCGSNAKSDASGAGDDGGAASGADGSAPAADAAASDAGTFGAFDAGGPPSRAGDASGAGDADQGAQADAAGADGSTTPDASGQALAGEAGASNDSGSGADSAGANGLGVDSRAAYCAGSGPPVTVGDNVSGVDECTGAIAELSFSHALCTCKDASVQGYLDTDSFDSNVAPYQPGQGGAAVGVDRDFLVAGVPNIGGSLAVDGPGGLTLAGAAVVDGDMQVQGNLSLAGYSTIARDLWVGGNLTSAGVITVARDLHEPGGAVELGVVTVGGSTFTSPFTLDEPCGCQDNEILDVDAIVSQGRALNDDASIGLLPGAFDAVVGAADVDLPCGRFYLDQIAGAGALTFHVSGRTALFVGGDIASTGALDFDVGPAGELDVFVAGNLIPTGVTSYGSIARPAAVRIYVGGTSDVVLTGAGAFGGNIYAPRANVILTGYSDVYGSIFAGDFEAPGAVFIHYDRGVLDAGHECPPASPSSPADAGSSPSPADDASSSSPAVDASSSPPPAADASSTPPPAVDAGSSPARDAGSPAPPPACQKCGSCSAGTACVSGSCGACTVDSQCCSPLVCLGGYCAVLAPAQ